jgi:rhodanese-related sulfurtransferase
MKIIYLLLLLSFAIGNAEAGIFTPTWQDTFKKIDKDFPGVRNISTKDFSQLSDADPSKVQLRVLDIREASEYKLSHLRNALHASDSKQAIELLRNTKKDIPVIVYCSVGYRSSAVAVDLQKAGYTNVRNLKGGIFTWANEGRPIFRAKLQVSQVHAYSRYWSALLDRRFAAELP